MRCTDGIRRGISLDQATYDRLTFLQSLFQSKGLKVPVSAIIRQAVKSYIHLIDVAIEDQENDGGEGLIHECTLINQSGKGQASLFNEPPTYAGQSWRQMVQEKTIQDREKTLKKLLAGGSSKYGN